MKCGSDYQSLQIIHESRHLDWDMKGFGEFVNQNERIYKANAMDRKIDGIMNWKPMLGI